MELMLQPKEYIEGYFFQIWMLVDVELLYSI